MNVPVEKVRVAMLRASQRKDVDRVMFTKRSGGERAVVVERKKPRRTGTTRTFG
jgi:hypothetical protein